MKIRDLKPPYRQLAEMRRTNESEILLTRAFSWPSTPEGTDFWDKVDDGETPEIPKSTLLELEAWLMKEPVIVYKIVDMESHTRCLSPFRGFVFDLYNEYESPSGPGFHVFADVNEAVKVCDHAHPVGVVAVFLSTGTVQMLKPGRFVAQKLMFLGFLHEIWFNQRSLMNVLCPNRLIASDVENVEKYFRKKKPIPAPVDPVDKYDTLQKIVEQLGSADYQSVGGPLENNTAFLALKRMAEQERQDLQNIKDHDYHSH